MLDGLVSQGLSPGWGRLRMLWIAVKGTNKAAIPIKVIPTMHGEVLDDTADAGNGNLGDFIISRVLFRRCVISFSIFVGDFCPFRGIGGFGRFPSFEGG